MGEWKRSVCPKDCPDCCGLLAKVEDGRVTEVRGDPEHPFTQGYICQKAHGFPQHVHSPHRITRPLKRNGPKGSGQFQPIGWDEALSFLADKYNEVISSHGPAAVLPYYYGGHMGVVQRNVGHAFFNRLGASHMLPTICGPAASAGYKASLGRGPSTSIETAADSDFIVIWGNNTLTTNLHAWPFFQKARRKGAKLVVIDPYKNRTAQKADRHLMPKAGTDAALALAIMQVLIEQDLLDQDFIAQQTLGFEELKQRAAEYPPAKAAEICGLDEAEIVSLALDYGQARAPFIRTGWGLARQLKGGMAMRTIALLPALVGAFGKPGGGIGRSLGGALRDLSVLTRPDLRSGAAREVNMVHLGNALTELDGPPIKLLHNYLCNPAAVAPQSAKVMAGLEREDLFLVVHEMFMTDTARMADLILPGASFMEVTDLYSSYGHNYLRMARPVVEPQGESRSMLDVFQDLAARMGFDDDVFSQTEDQFIEALLEQDSPALEGIDLGALYEGRAVKLNIPDNPYAKGFATPSGKVEFFSQAMADMGLDPLPNGEPSLDPEGQGRYPLQLITPPHHAFLNSAFNEIPAQEKKAGPAQAMIHPQDASARGIVDGSPVRLFNDRGEFRLQAKLTSETRPGLVVVEGIHWPSRNPGGLGVNQLTSQRLADMGQTCAFHCSLVEAEAAAD